MFFLFFWSLKNRAAKGLKSEFCIFGNYRQQGFGVLCVAITNELISLLVSLLEDLKVEGGVTAAAMSSSDSPAELNIFGHYTAWQRVLKLTTSVNLTTLLFNLASISYRKVCFIL